MTELVQENWIFLVLALVIGIAVAWFIFAASRRTKVTIEKAAEEMPTAARRNQALIDAAAAKDLGDDIPPATPIGMAGVGEAVAAAAQPVHVSDDGQDDLTRIKGVGPKLAQLLRSLGVTHFSQIALWDDAEIDRIDAQLGRFQGRIRRDDWVEQARLLASGDLSDYEARFGKL